MNIITRVSKQDGVWINLSTEEPVSPEYAEYLDDLALTRYKSSPQGIQHYDSICVELRGENGYTCSDELDMYAEAKDQLADEFYELRIDIGDDEDLGPAPVCVPPCNETSNEDADADRAMYYSDQAIQALHEEELTLIGLHLLPCD